MTTTTTTRSDPREWGRKPCGKKSGSSGKVSTSGGPGLDFIDFVAGTLNVPQRDIYKATRGKGGGTLADFIDFIAENLHTRKSGIYQTRHCAAFTFQSAVRIIPGIWSKSHKEGINAGINSTRLNVKHATKRHNKTYTLPDANPGFQSLRLY